MITDITKSMEKCEYIKQILQEIKWRIDNIDDTRKSVKENDSYKEQEKKELLELCEIRTQILTELAKHIMKF